MSTSTESTHSPLDLLAKLEHHCNGAGAMLDQIRRLSQQLELSVLPLMRQACTENETQVDLDTRCILRGTTQFLPIADLISVLATHSRTGTLHVTTEDETFILEFVEGQVAHASSDLMREDLRLGEILLERGKITTRQLEDFCTAYMPTSGPLGVALERAQLVTRKDLREALEFQVQNLFHDLFEIADASFDFFDRNVGEVDQRIEMNVTQLLLDSARANDEKYATPESSVLDVVDDDLESESEPEEDPDPDGEFDDD